MARQENTLVIEDARMVFRNFAGKEGKYNKEGDRNFCVLLDPQVAEDMANDGWNVKTLKSREEGEPGTPYIQVSVGYKGRPPHIVMITSRGRTDIGEDAVELLDWAEIRTVDIIIRPYNWDVNGEQGVKAYLKSMFMTIEEDYLEMKYAEIPDVPTVIVEEG
jgi:hypothetical protein